MMQIVPYWECDHENVWATYVMLKNFNCEKKEELSNKSTQSCLAQSSTRKFHGLTHFMALDSLPYSTLSPQCPAQHH